MLTLGDVLFKMARRMHGYTGVDKSAAIERFVLGYACDLHLAITTDVKETEETFRGCYGKGQTFYFPLQDYEHGKALATQMHWLLLEKKPDMSAHTGSRFSENDKLFFVVFAPDKMRHYRQRHTATVLALSR